MPRLRIALLTIVAALASSASAQEAERDASLPMGILIRNPDTADGEPPYALVDQFGRTQRYIEPSRGIDLAPYVGSRVHVRHDTGRTLLASQLELPARPRREARELRTVSPAQFVPPRRLSKLDEPGDRRRKPRRYAVVPTQLIDDDRYLDDAAGDLPGPDTDPIDLDKMIAEQGGDSLPEPSNGSRLEPIPADDYSDSYYEELPPAGSIHSGHDPDCPHCAKQRASAHVSHSPGDACPTCRAKVAPLVTKCRHCGGGAGWCGPTCNPASRRGVYGRIDYLLWWFDGMGTPPLVTAATDGTSVPTLAPGQPTQILYGNDEILDDARNGLRLTVGTWLDDRRDIAIEADWIWFAGETESFSAGGVNGPAALGRPFYDINPLVGDPRESVQLVNFPGTFSGTVGVAAGWDFESFGVRLRTGICCREIGGCGPCNCESCSAGVGGLLAAGRSNSAISRVDFTIGYRYADLDEYLRFSENATDITTTPNTQLALNESFDTSNEFHGLDLGFVYDWQSTRWGLELASRIAIGGTQQQLRINGNTMITQGAASTTDPGGLLAQTSNIGSYERDRFSVLPELSARLSYRVTPQLSLSAGYTLLYWANVLRPGDQIDLSVDPALIADPLAPTTAFSHPRLDIEETSLWAHGFNFGADYRY
ncbi:MAG: BBP7 family outer membrane beta-barrel protein [Planctomycetota bacterium]